MRGLSDLMNLTGRCALVTGGAGHIGLAIGEALVELGANVAILDLNPEQCQSRVDALNQHGPGQAFAFPLNLLYEDQIRNCAKRVIREMGGLDILVHNAAYVGTTAVAGWAVPFQDQTVESWDASLRVNLTTAFILIQETRSALEASGHGSVIFTSSIYGLIGPDMRLYEGTPMAHPSGYAASKGGLIQLCRHFSTLLAPKIRVNALSPGGVWRNPLDVFHERYKSRTPLGRMATEEDLKGGFAYLASDLSSYVTGHNLVIDGGWTAW